MCFGNCFIALISCYRRIYLTFIYSTAIGHAYTLRMPLRILYVCSCVCLSYMVANCGGSWGADQAALFLFRLTPANRNRHWSYSQQQLLEASGHLSQQL